MRDKVGETERNAEKAWVCLKINMTESEISFSFFVLFLFVLLLF